VSCQPPDIVTWETQLTPILPHFPPNVCAQNIVNDAETLASYVLFIFVDHKNMSDTDARAQTAQYPDVADDHNAVRELQRVLSLGSPSFYRRALRLLGNRADAEDAVQEALLAAHKHLHRFRGQSQMSTWLTTIVSNCARMQLRRRPRQIHMPLDGQIGEDERHFISEKLADTRPTPEDECRKSELAAHLRKCVALLSPILRRTFQLRVADGLSIFETAQVLGVPQGTVKAQLSRARTNLARYMQRALEPRSGASRRHVHVARAANRKVISRVGLSLTKVSGANSPMANAVLRRTNGFSVGDQKCEPSCAKNPIPDNASHHHELSSRPRRGGCASFSGT